MSVPVTPPLSAAPDPAPVILLVDDEPRNIQLLVYMLTPLGYEIRQAHDGSEAIASALAHPPDLVLLDIMMPDVDGYAVCQALRDTPATAHVPVIFLTALIQPREIVKGFQAGAVDYLTKPFHAEELKARVRAHLELKLGREKLERANSALHQINEGQKRLFGLLAHDLRAPLAAAESHRESLTLLAHRSDPRQADDLSARMDTEMEKVRSILDELLEWAMTSAGASAFEPVLLDLHSLAETIISETIPVARRRAVAIENTIPPTAEAHADARMTTTLLRNLLAHSLRRTPAGGRIILSAFNRTPEEIEISFRDTGPALAPETLASLLRPRSAAGKSPAMNLLLSHEFVLRHGGRLWTESIPDGSILLFTLPVRR